MQAAGDKVIDRSIALFANINLLRLEEGRGFLCRVGTKVKVPWVLCAVFFAERIVQDHDLVEANS
jgi:hypothetical protein